MMVNSTLSYFILSAYIHVGSLKYLYFLLTAALYLVIIVVNASLLVVICVNRSLHEPMYLFLCSLLVNELYGSSGLFPFLLLQILSDVHSVPAQFCFLQIYCLYTYAHVEFCNLAVMSYDRYVAICWPLQYNTHMTFKKTVIFIGVLWLYSFLKFLITFSLNVRLPLCGNTISSLYCHNYLVVKLACSDTKVNNIFGLFGTVLTVLVPLLPILFSYTKILKILQSRFDLSDLSAVLRLLLSLYFLLIQPLLTPVIYGMQMSKIRNGYKSVFSCKTLTRCRDA
ncbi:olfactory receptor-like protein DTMT [Embiotoca jacksoni]|uniref:olfactory receptor-like protein DTMT n=1 Tax=Embiotoca jacksoni TaxID=100190 RepID=UPI0037038664